MPRILSLAAERAKAWYYHPKKCPLLVNELAEQIAVLYARKKWGPRVRMDKGSLVFDAEAGKEKEREQAAPERPKKGLSR